MFDNIGRKIKNLAELVAWLGIIFSVIVGFIICCMDERMIVPGLLVGVVGSFASWLLSIWSYAFGQQVESTENIEKMLESRLATLGVQNSFKEAEIEVLSAEGEKETSEQAEEREKEEEEEDKRAFVIMIGIALVFILIIVACAVFLY